MMPRATQRGRRFRASVAHHLGIAIVTGHHAPGDVLMGELQGSATLEVSRGAYREAIQTLAAKGLVKSRPRIGTIVQPVNCWNLLDREVLAWALIDDHDVAIFSSLIELRTIVQPWAASIAAQRRSRLDIAAMRQAVMLIARHGLEHITGEAADCAFHAAILRATGNEFIEALTPGIAAAVTMSAQLQRRSRFLQRDPILRRRRVLSAIVKGDALEAASAMRMLIGETPDGSD